jgi:2',3'-cyclic-nucleotide 2'-phosphodiesterase (5'-nucleotidase family)
MDSLLAQSPGLKIDLIVGGRSYRPNTSAPWLFGPGFARGSVGGYRDLNEQVKTAEENVRNAKGMNARGLLSGGDLAKAQNELEELKKQQSEEKGEGGGHNTCVVRTARDGRELGRMDLVFGAKSVIKTYSPKTLTMETTDPSSAEMLALVRKRIPNFVDNPTTP